MNPWRKRRRRRAYRARMVVRRYVAIIERDIQRAILELMAANVNPIPYTPDGWALVRQAIMDTLPPEYLIEIEEPTARGEIKVNLCLYR